MKKTKFLDKRRLMKNTTSVISILVAAFLIFSSTVAAIDINQETYKVNGNKLVLSEACPEQTPYSQISSNYQYQSQQTGRDDWLYYHSGFDDNAIGFSGAIIWEGAMRLTPTELGAYDGYNLETVKWYHYDTTACTDVVIKIYDAGTSSAPGSLITSEAYTVSTVGWYEVDLTTPATIDASKDIWVSIEFDQTTAGFPFGIDEGPQILDKGGFIYYSGGWTQLYLLGLDYNWCLEAKVVEGGPGPEHDVGVISINSPEDGTCTGAITPEVTVKNFGNNSESAVPVNMQITEICVPASVLYSGFETSVPPSGWTTAGYGFTQSTGAKVGSYCAKAQYGGYGEWADLTTSSFDGSAGNLMLEFWHKQLSWYGDQDTLEVMASNDDGTSWTPVAYYPNSMDWTYETIDLDSFITPTSTMQIKFYATLDYGYGVYLDEVNVFVYPSGIPEYDETVYVDLDIGEVVDVTFSDWTPDAWQDLAYENVDVDYELYATTLLPGDEKPSNDDKDATITLHFPYLHDIEVLSINTPVDDGPAQTQDVEVTIKNVGQNEECCYPTNVLIGTQVVIGTVLEEHFSSGVPPAGWTDEHGYCWYASSTTYSGGSSPEAKAPYYYLQDGKVLYSYAFDLSAYAGAILEFKTYINHYGSGYSLHAVVSTDATTWTDVWSLTPTGSGQYEISVPIPAGSATTYVGFMLTGDPWYINYWYLDDVIVNAVDIIPEYDEDQCTVLLEPGEEAVLTFSDWTPDDLSNYGFSGPIDYVIVAEAQCTDDTNPDNDKLTDGFTLDYWHDVGVQEITSPSMGRGLGDVIFEQLPHDPDQSWSIGTSDAGAGYKMYENFWDLTEPIGSINWWGLALIYDAGWNPGDPNNLVFDVSFYEDDAGAPGAEVAYFADVGPTITYTGQYYAGFEMIYWELENLPAVVTLSEGWVAVQSQSGGAGEDWFMWHSAKTGDGQSYQEGSGWTTYDRALQLIAGAGGPHPPPPITLFIPKGSQPIAAIVENLGTFEETDLTVNAQIYEYITNLTNGTLIQEENVTGIDLDPLGGEEPVGFADYNFAIEGVYSVEIAVPLAIDDAPNNNLKRIGIGCDDTAPTSDHTVTPSSPDGENGWYVTDVTIDFTADDGTEPYQSGVDYIEYRINGATPQTGDSVTLTDDGDFDVEYRAVDNVGNEESWNPVITIHIDQTAPAVDLAWEASGSGTDWQITFTATCSDATSGMNRVEFFIEGAYQFTDDAEPYTWIIDWSSALEGVIFYAYAYDDAGNENVDEVDGGDIDAVSLQGQATPTNKVVQQKQINSL